MQNIPLTEARARLGELVDRVRYGGEAIGITKGGKPVAAVVPYSYAVRIWHQKDELMTIVREIREQNRGLGLTEDELTALINEAIREVPESNVETAIVSKTPE